jgi:branched-chain amino acid transport system ATP-binding protein
MNAAVLEAKNVHAGYGPVKVLHGVDLVVDEGEMVAILGANGAGKTTLLRALSGMIPIRGEIRLDGGPITGRPPEALLRRGLSHVPEGRGTFSDLTVDENLMLGAYTRRDPKERARNLEMVCSYFPILADRRHDRAGNLSGGEQQMLALSRALMANPRVLLLDEPSLGLAPQVVRRVFDIIERINLEQKLTVVLVEQNADIALRMANRAYLLEAGQVAMAMSAQALMADDAVRRAYLGY